MCANGSRKRRSNLLGAFLVAGSDALREACESQLDFGGETAAALVILGYESGLADLGLGRILGLSKILGLSHAGTVRLVDKLVAEGMVHRARDEADHRAVLLTLTPAGKAARAEILAARHRALDNLLMGLSEDEQRQLEHLLDKMVAHWTPQVDPAVRICRLCDTDNCDECPVERADHPQPAVAH